MKEIIINGLFIILAIIAVAISAKAIVRLAKLNRRFNTAIVLIPLYKKSKWPIIGVIFIAICLFVDIIVMLRFKYYIPCIAVAIALLSLMALFIAMISTKSAVLDSGIAVPYRFIEWATFYDYSIIDGNSIFFCGDEQGFDTVSSATSKLRFDEANLDKLTFILNKYKSHK
ncbi:MAG: hypothetical protein IKM01_05210 [Clostridia bacterium]|nr:hypothetical protein [Clostridia bacterium]